MDIDERMKNEQSQRMEQGVLLYSIASGSVELTVVPQLGARILSLKNRQTGREWLWHPGDGLKLFANQAGDDFAASPLAGVDECIPTIAPCQWKGRNLPDHGEAWFAPWTVDAAGWMAGVLRTRVRFAVSPFELERTVSLVGSEVRLSYQLTNLGNDEECFLWALHPLLRIQPGDRLELPASVRQSLPSEAWLDAIDCDIPSAEGCAKIFAFPITTAQASIRNARTQENLTFTWNPAENNTLGIWQTTGGWHGHRHFALEPSNGSPDSLSDAARMNRCGRILPKGKTLWSVQIRVG